MADTPGKERTVKPGLQSEGIFTVTSYRIVGNFRWVQFFLRFLQQTCFRKNKKRKKMNQDGIDDVIM